MPIESEREDRAAESGGFARWESTELTLRGRREDDGPAAITHGSSLP
jgi:hypothetical protein